ncbi:hypothetical protein LCGC14_0245420 [marine sediment metagenome]|uniref:Uncharacterized protein n=1 Tax=marine sediment metagenome TaxID=412755 RepID=A0A0F9WQZ8_9ZZZZ
MANTINPDLVLTTDTYRDKDHSSITELSRARQLEGSWLSSVVTHMNYSSESFGKQNFPMLLQTEGMGEVEKVDHFEYKYPVIGRPKKTSMVAKTLHSGTDQPGVGGGSFKIIFKDKHFSNQQTLYCKSNISVRVQAEPKQVGDYWEYTVSLWGKKATFCPIALVTAGTIWSAGVHKVPFEESYGVEGRSYLGGTAQNMVSLVRHSYKLRGNIQSKIMLYTIKADGKTFQYYTDWEMFLADLTFAEACENDLWTSIYGKEDGEFIMIDANTQIPVTSGGGIDQQIPNTDTHSYLTKKQLNNIIRDITFNIAEGKANIEIWTGTGGMDDINEVLTDELKGFTLIDSKQFADGTGWDMVFGSFFKAFRHVDGHTITFRKHAMFDRGMRGDVSDLHPTSGLPKSSHDIYILDNSIYDGKRNFRYVMEKGREYTTWDVLGSIIPKGHAASTSRASDRDSSSVHGMKSQGIQIMKPTGLYKSECV